MNGSSYKFELSWVFRILPIRVSFMKGLRLKSLFKHQVSRYRSTTGVWLSDSCRN